MAEIMDTTGLPNFSITVNAIADEEQESNSLKSWMFGNPIREQLTMGQSAVEPGMLVANKNWEMATNSMGALRSFNLAVTTAIQDAAKMAQQNKQMLMGVGVFVGIIVFAKALAPAKGKRR